jgi:hypothetical protein
MHPHLLRDSSEDFLRIHGLLSNTESANVLVVGKTISRNAIICVICVSLVIAFTTGSVVGLLSHRVMNGLGAGTGVVGATVVLETLLFWVLR